MTCGRHGSGEVAGQHRRDQFAARAGVRRRGDGGQRKQQHYSTDQCQDLLLVTTLPHAGEDGMHGAVVRAVGGIVLVVIPEGYSSTLESPRVKRYSPRAERELITVCCLVISRMPVSVA